jgi:hypothetical protein
MFRYGTRCRKAERTDLPIGTIPQTGRISVGLTVAGWEGWMAGDGTAAAGWNRWAGTSMAMAGHGLELTAVGQPDPAHDVQLPQLHGPAAFPAAVVGLSSPSWFGLDETVADQGPVDAGQAGRWVDAVTDEFVGQAALAPAGMVAASTAAGIWWGQLWGRWERSARASSPPVR